MNKESIYNVDVERWVLSGILTDPYAQYMALDNLVSGDFFLDEHKVIFSSFLILKSEGLAIDVRNTNDYLIKIKKIEFVGPTTIEDLVKYYSGADTDYYISKLKSLSVKRQMLSIATEMTQMAFDHEKSAEELIGHFNKKITMLGTYSKHEFTEMREIFDNYKDNKDFLTVVGEECIRVANGEDIFDGVRSYYPHLDSLIGGFANGTNNIIGARSSSGKTTFLSNIFMNIHEHRPDIRMGFFSLEMQKSRIMEKIICCMAGVNFKDLQDRKVTVDGMGQLASKAKGIKEMNLTIFDHSGININEFKSHIRREIVRKGLNIVFLDYLSIVQAYHKTGNKHQEIDQISKGLQSIALELNIPIVTLSQLNRAIYARQDKTPVLADLRESGSIEEDADVVMLLHRPIHYATNLAPVKEDVTQLLVAKNRLRGDLGKVEFEFKKGRYYESPKIESLLPNAVVSCNEERKPYAPPDY